MGILDHQVVIGVGGSKERKRIKMEYLEWREKGMMVDIQVYLIRDYHDVMLGRMLVFQAGIIILMPNVEEF